MKQLAIVTGGSAGIGTETVRTLAGRGHKVVLACRDVAKGQGVAVGLPGDITVRALDLADLSSVHHFADDFDLGAVDILVNNAGVMAGPLGHTVDGFERQIGTNHLGHVALTALLLPRLLAAPAARVVNVSSIAAHGANLTVANVEQQLRNPDPYEPMQVYSNSKLANQLFTVELDRRAKRAGTSLRSIAAHPGVSATGLFSVNHRNRGRRLLPWFVDNAQKVVFQSARKGAACSVVAATDVTLQGGELIGPHGIKEWRGRPTTMSVYPAAQDEALAARLWDLSCDWVDAKFEFSA